MPRQLINLGRLVYHNDLPGSHYHQRRCQFNGTCFDLVRPPDSYLKATASYAAVFQVLIKILDTLST